MSSEVHSETVLMVSKKGHNTNDYIGYDIYLFLYRFKRGIIK